MNNEYMFYLSFLIYDKYLNDKNILLDVYFDVIKELYNDYLKVDNDKKTLIDSIYDYINDNETKIEKMLVDVID